MKKDRGKFFLIIILPLMAALIAMSAFTWTNYASTPTATTTPTLTATPTCIQLISPAEGTEFPRIGRMTFTWDALVAAASFQIVFTAPNGTEMRFSTRDERYSRYAESFPWGGEYQWQIVALDEDGKPVCSSARSTFKKAESRTTPQNAKPEEEDGNSGGGGGEEGPPDHGH